MRLIANIAGNQNHITEDLFAYLENIAPIIGPIMKPSEKAIPTKAIPFPRFWWFDTSVIIAMLKEMLPLLMPPTNLAKTNNAKLFDIAHNPYEKATPN